MLPDRASAARSTLLLVFAKEARDARFERQARPPAQFARGFGDVEHRPGFEPVGGVDVGARLVPQWPADCLPDQVEDLPGRCAATGAYIVDREILRRCEAALDDGGDIVEVDPIADIAEIAVDRH